MTDKHSERLEMNQQVDTQINQATLNQTECTLKKRKERRGKKERKKRREKEK